MSNRFSITNWPFAIKFGVPSALTLAVTLFIGVMALHTIDSLKADLREVVERKFNASILLADSVQMLGAANGSLYQMQTNQAAGIKQQVSDSVKKITDLVDKAIANLNTYKAQYASAGDSVKIDKAIADLKTYKDAITFVGSMLELDFKSTVNFLIPLAASYDATIANLSTISAKSLEDSRKQAKEAVETVASAKRLLYGISIPTLLLILCVTLWIASSTISSIRQLAESTKLLAGGNTKVDIDRLARNDELGQLVEALSVFRSNTDRINTMRTEQAQSEQKAEEEKKRMLQNMVDNFKSSVQSIITSVVAATTELYKTTEGMQKTVSSVSDQSGTARTLVMKTVMQVQQAEKTIQILSETVMKISSILEVIQNIARQINLLALNAAVEAARAGDAGKGFAVVASEVKGLAGQTHKATGEVSIRIVDVQQAFQEVVAVMKAIKDAIGNVDQHTLGTTNEIEKPSFKGEASLKITQEASQSIENIAGNISSITQSASKADSAAKEVLNAAQDLSTQSELLSRKVDIFLDGINKENS